MPCHSDYSDSHYYRDVQGEQRIREMYTAAVDEFTALLCSACHLLTPEQLASAPSELQLWWRAHQEWDARREAAEHHEHLSRAFAPF